MWNDTVRFQRGATLIVALIFLMIMTVLGVTAMQGGNQQENMARNARDHSLAFQAAEAALRAGEIRLNCFVDVPPESVAPPAVQSNAAALGPLAGVSPEEAIRDFWEACFVEPPNTPPAFCPPRSYLDGTATPPTETSSSFLQQVAQQPYYVIENTTQNKTAAKGLEPDSFCLGSSPTNPISCYRITAHGVGGTTNAVVILQSTAHYIRCTKTESRAPCPVGAPGAMGTINTYLINLDNRGGSTAIDPTAFCPP